MAETVFKCVWRNVGNVPTDVPRFPERAPRLVAHLAALDADILALSECRDSVLEDGTVVPITKFLADVAGTRYAIVNQDGTTTPSVPSKGFYLSLLIDKRKLLVSESKHVPIGGDYTRQLTPGTFNRSVHALRLLPKNVDGSVSTPLTPFWVLTVHLNIPKTANTAETAWLAANASDITRGEPYVIAGDMNCFPDEGRSEEQEAIMAAKHVDVFAHARELGTDRPMTTTFVGFLNDAFRCPDIYAGNQRLDRVYTRRDDERVQVAAPRIDTRLFLMDAEGTLVPEDPDESKVGRHDFPSDHFPLVMNIHVLATPAIRVIRHVHVLAEKDVSPGVGITGTCEDGTVIDIPWPEDADLRRAVVQLHDNDGVGKSLVVDADSQELLYVEYY